MSSFMQRARDRAQEAAARAQGAAAQLQDKATSGGGILGGSHGAASQPAAGSGAGVSAYTGSIPHALRQGLAQYYPRGDQESRASHVLSTALKGISIDHEATARETKSAARATYAWGVDQGAASREDGAGDAALVDVADRLAYILQTIGELEQAHVGRIEAARGIFKRIVKAETDLAGKRERRVKVQRELSSLMPERAKGNTARIAPLEAKLKEYEAEDREAEEELGKLKRECLRDSYEAHFDSLIELGEKTALVARYGKLLTHQLPVEAPVFPANKVGHGPNESSWSGAKRTASLRAALAPALASYQPAAQLPELSSEGGSLTDTESFGVTHATELHQSPYQGTDLHDDGPVPHSSTSSRINLLGVGGASQLGGSSGLSRVDSGSSGGVSHHGIAGPGGPVSPPLATIALAQKRASVGNEEMAGFTSVGGVGGITAAPTGSPVPPQSGSSGTLLGNINNQPTALPPSPSASPATTAAQRHRVPPAPSPSGTAGPGTDSKQAHQTDVKGELADGPSVAETGVPITGPGGPSSGTLSPRVPRRPSSTTSPSTATAPPAATGAAAAPAAGSAAYYETTSDARARKEAEAKAEQEEVRRHAVSARLRRDGTVIRRGEQGFEEAEEEGLPAYHE